jgi:hypothetical protein
MFTAIFSLFLSMAQANVWSTLESSTLLSGQFKREQVKDLGVVIFVSHKCPCSNSHLTHLLELHEKYPDVSMVAVQSDFATSETIMREYYHKNLLGLTIVNDRNFKIADELGAIKTPHAYIIDRVGKILYQGGVSNSVDITRAKNFYLRDALQDITEGKEVRRPEARALGCYIQRPAK